MDKGIQEALTHWLEVELRERWGPSLNRVQTDGDWRGSHDHFDAVFREIDADAAAEIADVTAANRQRGIHTAYANVWPRLSERTIVTLLKAGAVNYIRDDSG
tara:strand:- start:184 stop:489 length:306 start_codon:yes stop_codon:yes gene_type:complete